MAFWKKIFKSKYTGAEIDAAVAKAGDATKVTANPTLAGTEAALEGLQVGDTKYKVIDSKPVITLAATDIASIMTALVTQYATATDKISYGKHKLSAAEATAVKAKFDPILLRPNKDCFLMVEGFETKYDAYIYTWGGATGIVVATNTLRMNRVAAPAFDNMISFYISIEENGDVYIETACQKINVNE